MTDTAMTDEHKLIQEAKNGNKKSFDKLILEYQSKIVSLCNRYLRDSSEAQDVAQESFIKAYMNIKKFREDSAFYTWLFRIASNTAKNYLIARKRRPLKYVKCHITEIEEEVDDIYTVDYDTPEEILYANQLEGKLEIILNELPSHIQETIILREIEGLPYESIADLMNCPVGTVRSRIFRARELIEEKL